MATCARCGGDFSALEGSHRRSPCPDCGATALLFDDTLALGAEASDQAQLESLRNDKIIAYRESEHKGRASSADDCLDGSVSYSFTRSSPQGEEDTLAVCIRLVTVLNLACASWSEPQNGSDGVDCVCLDLAAGSMRLAIQVVRANVDSAWWRKIGETGSWGDDEGVKRIV